MLSLLIPAGKLFNEADSTFIFVERHVLQLEHSLVSLSKWESKWHKPFISKKNQTVEETVDYVRAMTTTQNVDPNVYLLLTQDHLEQIREYINAPMTATTFREEKNKKTNSEIITAEIIYYWMIAFNIPFECQRWHLNRLLTLINVCSVKNQPTKKTNPTKAAQERKALNEARKAQLNSKG